MWISVHKMSSIFAKHRSEHYVVNFASDVFVRTKISLIFISFSSHVVIFVLVLVWLTKTQKIVIFVIRRRRKSTGLNTGQHGTSGMHEHCAVPPGTCSRSQSDDVLTGRRIFRLLLLLLLLMMMACAPSHHRVRLLSATDLPGKVESVDKRSRSSVRECCISGSRMLLLLLLLGGVISDGVVVRCAVVVLQCL